MIPGPPTRTPNAVHLYIQYREAGIDRQRARALTIATMREYATSPACPTCSTPTPVGRGCCVNCGSEQ